MPNLNDMARMMAAGEGAGMEAPAGDPGMVDAMAPAEGGDPAADMAGALDMLESSVMGLPPEIQEKARQHIEALRAIAEEGAAAGAQTEPEAAPAEPAGPTGGDLGMMA